MTDHSHRPGESLPSWKSNLKSLLYCAVGSSIFWTVLMLLSGTGLLRTNGRNYIDPDGVWAAFCAAAAAVSWVMFFVDFKRDDHGIRREGLTSLLCIGVPVAAAVQLAFMTLWPLVVDKVSSGHTAIAMYTSDAVTFGLIAMFIVSLYTWCAMCLLIFSRQGFYTPLFGIIVLLAVGAVGVWQGIGILDDPASAAALQWWSLIAILGLILLPTMATFVTRRKRSSVPSNPYDRQSGTAIWNR